VVAFTRPDILAACLLQQLLELAKIAAHEGQK
jgi:hypothetical protein